MQNRGWSDIVFMIDGMPVDITPIEKYTGNRDAFQLVPIVSVGSNKDRHPITLEKLDTE